MQYVKKTQSKYSKIKVVTIENAKIDEQCLKKTQQKITNVF